uniref:NAD-dependent epimerase/dehydratase domain-containing protein n=1 Tax=Oryza glumipatula TaxID=40148 RepID=A0A0D9YRT9_9ORYZ
MGEGRDSGAFGNGKELRGGDRGGSRGQCRRWHRVRNSCGLQCGPVQWPSKPSPTKTRRRTTKQQSCTFRGYRKINWQTVTAAATWWSQCKVEEELGKGGVQESSAHNLFDRMTSQHKVFNDDERIAEPVPIKSTMNKEGISMDEALDRILERFELMEANRRQEEKFNQILQKLEEVEAHRSKAAEETIASIKATTAVLKATSPTAPMASPTPARTKCLTECPNNNLTWATASSSHISEDTAPTVAWELGDNKDKGHAPCVVTKDSLEVTPTMCSTKCSGPTVEPDLTVAVVVTSATTAAASMELVAAGNAIGATYINNLDHPKVTHAKCLMLDLGSNSGDNQTMVTFQTLVDMTKGVFTPDATIEVSSPRKIAEMDLVIVMPTGCSMLFFDKGASELLPVRRHVMWQLLLEQCKRNPWSPPNSVYQVNGIWELWHVPWLDFNYFRTRLCLMPPWPSSTQIGTIMLWLVANSWLRIVELKPWPDPQSSQCSIGGRWTELKVPWSALDCECSMGDDLCSANCIRNEALSVALSCAPKGDLNHKKIDGSQKDTLVALLIRIDSYAYITVETQIRHIMGCNYLILIMCAAIITTTFHLAMITTQGNNVYGTNQLHEKLIARLILLTMRGLPLPIHGNGSNVRNYLYCDDVAKAFEVVLTRVSHVYHIGTAKERRVIDEAKDISHSILWPKLKHVDVQEDGNNRWTRDFSSRSIVLKGRKDCGLCWCALDVIRDVKVDRVLQLLNIPWDPGGSYVTLAGHSSCHIGYITREALTEEIKYKSLHQTYPLVKFPQLRSSAWGQAEFQEMGIPNQDKEENYKTAKLHFQGLSQDQLVNGDGGGDLEFTLQSNW